MTDREAIKGLQNIVEYWTLNPHEQDCAKTAISALQEREEREKGCGFCLNANIDPELEGRDLSYHCVGYAEKGYRLLVASGGGRPMEILFEQWRNDRWSAIGFYEPRFCPMCGRPLETDMPGED